MIHLVGEDARTVPNWFKRRLKDIDAALVCYFNPFRCQFVIDRCVKGGDCLSSDHVSCEKTNVLLFPHMSERVLDELKGMDAWTKYGTLEAQRAAHENAKADFDAKQEAAMRDDFRHAGMDNRKQLSEALTLIQRHDMGTNTR